MRLTRREYRLAVGVAVITIAWALFAFGFSPMLERMETLKRVIPEKQNELDRLRVKAGEYMSLREELEDLRAKISSQEKNFELLPFIESLVEQCSLTQNVKMMKQVASYPDTDFQEVIVEIEIENVTLRQLCEFIGRFQLSNSVVSIKRLIIKKNITNPDLLDSQIEVRTITSAPSSTPDD
ncbi:MAG: hypothetical protein JXM79_09230 [Sedimentisphaerales bacterium]|nr:hypothetical protein [Sedimentisphaerales bacterium]